MDFEAHNPQRLWRLVRGNATTLDGGFLIQKEAGQAYYHPCAGLLTVLLEG
jgi:hypothetical protein